MGIIALAAFTGCRSAGRDPQSLTHDDVRPSVAERPVDRGAPPGRPTRARPCRARDLSLRYAGANGASGHVEAYLRLRNTGSQRCGLTGWPRRVVLVQAGRPRVLATRDGGYLTTGLQRSRPMRPGATTLLDLESTEFCSAADPDGGDYGPPFYRTVLVTLRNGGLLRTRLPPSGRIGAVCPVVTSRFAR